MRKKWIWIVGIVIVLIILVAILSQCGKKAMGKAMQALDDEQNHIVARGDIESRIEITGEVQPQNLISLKSKVSGKIVKFYADENDFVRIGQKIADIEPDYNQANTLFNTKAQLKRAKIHLDKAQKDLEDKTVLLENGYISQESYDAALRELQNAQIEHEQATNQYEVIQDLDVPGKVTHVYATATGVVIERKVNEGEMVQSSLNSFGEGTVVMKIADLSKMIIKSNINEVDIAKFSLGQKAKISLDALAYEQFEGEVVKIAPMAIVENNAKVFPVEISINADGHKAKPGMTAAVSILGEDRKDVIIIPIRAVFTNDDDEDIVYLLPKQGKEKTDKSKAPAEIKGIPTRVKLGANDMQMVEVISGLKEGDVIMLKDPGQKPVFPMMM
ncbi:MAG TPA: efflux RND transporter periplasmic adaptor subunit [Candidatus Cloacimonas sp.]|jgi:HlyD family secretion protein|nr:efflux RND transporter periplasmic adaptor subunit [Candidatus Cloacimonas sp.]